MERTISFSYARNLNKNEIAYSLLKERLNSCVLSFIKNTLLQFFCADFMSELIDVSSAISEGERGRYLYQKGVELCAKHDVIIEEFEKSGVGEQLQLIVNEFSKNK